MKSFINKHNLIVRNFLKIFLLVTILILIFPIYTFCEERLVNMYYYVEDDNNIYLESNPIYFNELSDRNTVYVLFNNFFENEYVAYIPTNTKLLNVYLYQNDLFIDLSSDVLKHGGNYYERMLLEQIYINAFQFSFIETVTILVDGEYQALPEGQQTYKVKNNVPIQSTN